MCSAPARPDSRVRAAAPRSDRYRGRRIRGPVRRFGRLPWRGAGSACSGPGCLVSCRAAADAVRPDRRSGRSTGRGSDQPGSAEPGWRGRHPGCLLRGHPLTRGSKPWRAIEPELSGRARSLRTQPELRDQTRWARAAVNVHASPHDRGQVGPARVPAQFLAGALAGRDQRRRVARSPLGHPRRDGVAGGLPAGVDHLARPRSRCRCPGCRSGARRDPRVRGRAGGRRRGRSRGCSRGRSVPSGGRVVLAVDLDRASRSPSATCSTIGIRWVSVVCRSP